MRIATTNDLQAMVDYWNANLIPIENAWVETCGTQTMDDFRKFIQQGISVFEEENCLICGIISGNNLNVVMSWSSSTAKMKAGLIMLWNEAKDRGLTNTFGIVKPNTTASDWYLTKGFTYQDKGTFYYFDDTIDNFLSKL